VTARNETSRLLLLLLLLQATARGAVSRLVDVAQSPPDAIPTSFRRSHLLVRRKPTDGYLRTRVRGRDTASFKKRNRGSRLTTTVQLQRSAAATTTAV